MTAHEASDPLGDMRGAGWIVIAAGVISVVAGLLAIAYPDVTLAALAIFGGINLIVIGLMSVFDAFSAGSDGGSRALSAILGVLGLIAGLVLLRRPGETLLVLLLVLGIWLVVSGTVNFFRSFDRVEGRAAQMLVAISEIVLGILILAVPDVSLRTVAIFAGIGFVLRGLLAIYTGWQLHKAGASRVGRVAPAG
jgi:uncharacterized membrane protein HdeD (DUF308 family)